jgi:hypothetical protein
MMNATVAPPSGPRFTLPRWNPALNILLPLTGIVLLAALVEGPFAGNGNPQPAVSSEAAAVGSGSTEALADPPADFNPLQLYRDAAQRLATGEPSTASTEVGAAYVEPHLRNIAANEAHTVPATKGAFVATR